MEEFKKTASYVAMCAAVLFVCLGFITNWSFSQDRTYLTVSCLDGLDAQDRCASSNWSEGSQIYVHVMKDAQKVLIYSDPSKKTQSGTTLENCTIYDDTDWKCNPDGAGSVIGAVGGRFYTISNQLIGHLIFGSANSSLGGWNYFLYRIGMSHLREAMADDGFKFDRPQRSDDSSQSSTEPDNGASSSNGTDLMTQAMAADDSASAN